MEAFLCSPRPMSNVHNLQSQSLDAAARIMSGIIQQIAFRPQDISTEIEIHTSGPVLRIMVHQEDLDRIMGNEGRTIRSLRTIAATLSQKCSEDLSLEFTP